MLDLSGIEVTIQQCYTIIKPCMFYLQVTFKVSETEDAIKELISKYRDCSIKHILTVTQDN